jgi:hypothetical protein
METIQVERLGQTRTSWSSMAIARPLSSTYTYQALADVSHRRLADATEGSAFDGCGFIEIQEVGCTCFQSAVVGCDVKGVSVKVDDPGGTFLFQLGNEDVV